MLIIGIDPGITGSICFFRDGKIIDVIEMPNMPEGKKNLEKTIANFISTEIAWVPLNTVDVEKDKVEAAIEFLETLEDDDDVQSVYSNINFNN